MDVPVPPGPVDADGEATESSREELELFFELVADVIAEEGEPRQFVLKSPCLPATVRPPGSNWIWRVSSDTARRLG